jgi:hypothetical protein
VGDPDGGLEDASQGLAMLTPRPDGKSQPAYRRGSFDETRLPRILDGIERF